MSKVLYVVVAGVLLLGSGLLAWSADKNQNAQREVAGAVAAGLIVGLMIFVADEIREGKRDRQAKDDHRNLLNQASNHHHEQLRRADNSLHQTLALQRQLASDAQSSAWDREVRREIVVSFAELLPAVTLLNGRALRARGQNSDWVEAQKHHEECLRHLRRITAYAETYRDSANISDRARAVLLVLQQYPDAHKTQDPNVAKPILAKLLRAVDDLGDAILVDG